VGKTGRRKTTKVMAIAADIGLSLAVNVDSTSRTNRNWSWKDGREASLMNSRQV